MPQIGLPTYPYRTTPLMRHKIFTGSLALATTALVSGAAMGQLGSGGHVFDASKHQKSHGAELTVIYPVGLTARASNRPRVVQSFVGTSEGVDLVMTLGLEAGEEDIEAYCASRTPEDWRKSFQDSNMQVLHVQAVRWKNRPSIKVVGAQITMSDGFQIHSRTQTFSICHKRYRVSLTCGTSAGSDAKVKSLMQQARATCERFYDSLTFNE